MRSLESRIVLLQLVLSATVITVFACSAVWLSSRALEREEGVHLGSIASQMARSIEREWTEEGDLQRAAVAAMEENGPVGVRIDVLDEQRGPVYSSAPDSARSTPAGARQASVLLPRGAWVVATTSTEPRRRAMAALITALAIGAVPLFLATLAVSRGLARGALRPLISMTRQAELASTAGEVRSLGGASDPTEVATLAAAFNRLLARLDALLQAERHFTRDAAHELRTPLTVIAGELEHAAADAALSTTQKEAVARALHQARQMSGLVDALLLLRRSEGGVLDRAAHPIPLNLSDVVREVAAELSGAQPERAQDLFVEADDEVLVAGDATLLAAAIRNLLSNAFKFTRHSQPIRVSVSAGASRSSVVVEDGGPGIAAEDLERIFDPFYRGPGPRADGIGFGLGLPLLRRVARAHGGDVMVGRSSLGGASFALDLPRWPDRLDRT